MRHMNRCNVPHFVMMKATISQERESAVGPATGNLTQGDLRNDPCAKQSADDIEVDTTISRRSNISG